MSVIKKVAFYTLGCKLNFSETSTISRDFQRNDYMIVSASKKADIYIINTCSVTQNADNKFKNVVYYSKFNDDIDVVDVPLLNKAELEKTDILWEIKQV